MHAIQLKELQPALGEMQRQFGITLLAPGIGIKIVKKNNSLVESGKKERSVTRYPNFVTFLANNLY